MDLPMDKICRICLHENEKNRSLNEIRDQKSLQTYKDTIMECLKVTINDMEGLPSLICKPCIGELEIAYKLTMTCLGSQTKLMEVLKRKNQDFNSGEMEIKSEVKDYDDELRNEEFGMGFDVNEVKIEYIFSDGHEIETDTDCSVVSKMRRPRKFKRRLKKSGSKLKKELKTKIKRRKKVHELMECEYPGCNFSTKFKNPFREHVKKVHEPPQKCDLCGKISANIRMLKNHKIRVHRISDEPYMCDVCGASFIDKRYMMIHLRRHQGETTVQCSICPKSFLLQATLNRHMLIHTGVKPYSCDKCGKRFSDKYLVNRHMVAHSEERRFNCHICGQKCKTKPNLDNHLRHHGPLEEKYFCDKCGKAFNAKGNLRLHIKKVHSDRSGKCNICGAEFSNLYDHMLKHTGETPYQCHICSRSFSGKNSLSSHISRHLNEDKIKCNVKDCTETFPLQSMLDFHILKYHVKERPCVCQHCKKGFYRKSDLSRHTRLNHGEVAGKNESIKSTKTVDEDFEADSTKK